jgi:CBS domain-containing protein
MRVHDVMTRNVECISPEASLHEAAARMKSLDVGPLPVCENDRIVGMLTDRDITVRATAAGLSPGNTSVDLVMTESVRCCHASQSAADVLALMSTVQIRRMPVVDDAQRLVGMLALGDLAARHQEGVAEALERISTPSQPDRTWAAAA